MMCGTDGYTPLEKAHAARNMALIEQLRMSRTIFHVRDAKGFLREMVELTRYENELKSLQEHYAQILWGDDD